MFYKKTINLSVWKETLLSTIAIIIFMLIFVFFPSESGNGILSFLQGITKYFFMFFLCPWLFVIFVLRKNFSNYGFNIKNKRTGLILAGIALVFSLLLSYILIRYTHLFDAYIATIAVLSNFWIFVLKELVLFNLVLFFMEYFFKGFVLNVYREKFLYGAIFIQAFLYIIPAMLVSSDASFIPMIIIATLGGIISYIARSFFYSYLYSLLYFILLDSFAIYLLKNSL